MLALQRADSTPARHAVPLSLPPSSSEPALLPSTTSIASLLVTPQPVSSFSKDVAAANFAYERPSTSLNDLEIVRKIVEREGCIEALQHLLSPHSGVTNSLEADVGYCYMGPRSVSASRRSVSTVGGVSPLVAPMVMQSVLGQLRVVGVQIIEMIVKWRRTARDAHTFQWRGLNYLLKMAGDLDFLAASGATIEPLRKLRLERNPLLSAMHLDHPLLVREAKRETVPPEVMAELQRLLPDVSLHAGGVDRLCLFQASKVLAAELALERRRQHLQRLSDQFGGVDEPDEQVDEGGEVDTSALTTSSITRSVHWSHRPVVFASRSSPSGGQFVGLSTSTPTMKEAEDEVVVARELLAQAEHELGALREQLATLHRQLKDADEGLAPPLPPDKRRRLQTRIGGMVNDLKFRSGDVFQRRNDLRRREKASDRKGPQQQKSQVIEAVSSVSRAVKTSCSAPNESVAGLSHGLLSLVGLDSAGMLEEMLQQDELRRHETVDRFSKWRASSTSAARQRARSAPAVRRPTSSSKRVSTAREAELGTDSTPMRCMTVDDVQQFVDALGLGLAPLSASTASISASSSRLTYGALLKAQGIDGAMLAAATDRDLEELGVALRLHRVRVLDAVRAAQ